MTRILITGFGPFPGAPSNPTMAIAKRLGALRRPRYAQLERSVRLLPTTWAMLDDVPAMIRDARPDAVLMFGLASRRRRITPERRAINLASILRVDAKGGRPHASIMAKGAPFAIPSAFSATRLAATLRRDGLPSAESNSAGDYLCNALSWKVLETGTPAIFIHVPRPRRKGRPIKAQKRPRPSMADLHRAAELLLMAVSRR